MAKSSEKPSKARYKSENRRVKNKIRKLEKYTKKHPKDLQTMGRLKDLKEKK